jgi:hypothetical protein
VPERGGGGVGGGGRRAGRRARARDAAAFLVADTVRKVAEDEQTLRDYYGVPIDRAEVAKRPRVPEEGVFLLDTKRDGGVATEEVDDESFEFVRGVPVDEIASDDDALSTLSTCSSSRDGEATTCAADVRCRRASRRQRAWSRRAPRRDARE